MSTHRYWRVCLPRPSDSYLAALGEIELRETAGGANVASSATVTAPTGASYPAANLVDGSASTFWQASQVGADAAIVFDFGTSPRDIAEITIVDIPTNAIQRVNSALLQYSNDSVGWSTLAAQLLPIGLMPGSSVTTTVDSSALAYWVRAAPMMRLGTAFPNASTRVLGPVAHFDATDGGGYRVAGTVQIDATPDVPVSRRVRLFNAMTGRIVRETWSGADGVYSFVNIRAGTYFVVAHDNTLEYNAVIRDRIEAAPMP